MKRQFIVLNDIKYLIEYNDYNKMISKTKSKFIMLRKYDIINDIAEDTDLYFIEYDLYNEYINNKEKIFYPNVNKDNTKYSLNIDSFTNVFYSENNNILFNDIPIYNIYEYNIKNKSYIDAYIPCNELRIYKPINRTNINSIIHVYNIINNIRIHYFCRPYYDLSLHISDEISFNNSQYNEYVSIFIPNIKELFKDNKYFYKEDVNINVDIYTYNDIKDSLNKLTNNNEYTKLNLLIEPYYIEQIEIENYSTFVKVFCSVLKNTEYNYYNVPLNIRMIGYNNISNVDSLYIVLNDNNGFASFVENNSFNLKSRIGFDDDGIISIINEFEYPESDNMSLEEAYLYYNKIGEEELDKYYNFKGWDNYDYYDILADEISEEFNLVSFNAAGYYIELSNTPSFDNIIYKSQQETRKIQNFAFALNNIFTSWNQYPGSLFARVVFIDKYLSTIIYGNIVVITKEWFKYCINDSQIYTLKSLTKKQVNNMNTENFNFIKNVNCIIHKTETNNPLNISVNNNKILYKPIFYKISDLQKIKIRQGVIQNIGINLSDYLDYVEIPVFAQEEFNKYILEEKRIERLNK